MPFSDGLAHVYLGMDQGFINKLGDMVFKAPYNYWYQGFNEGFAGFRG